MRKQPAGEIAVEQFQAAADAINAQPSVADELLKGLVDLHELEAKIGQKGGANYDDVRKHRREAAALWELARTHVYGPVEADNAPKTAAEAKRWDANAKRVAAKRESADL